MRKLVNVMICLLVVCFLFGALGGESGSSKVERKYQYLPARQNLWVIDHEKGAIMHFKFPDIEDKPIQRSKKPYLIDRKRFPRNDSRFFLSTSSLSNRLWFVNDKTGEVQTLRYRLDGTFVAEFQLQVGLQFQ